MIQYIPVEQFLYSPDNGRYCSYGIAAVSLTALHCEIVLFVSDISGDRSFVADLAQRCTHGQLDPIHVQDVIEDSL